MTSDPSYEFHVVGDLYHRLVEVLDTVATEYRVNFDEDGIHTAAVNPSNTSMIDFSIPADAFEKYSSYTDGQIGLNLDPLESRARYIRKGRGSNPGDDIEIWGDDREMFTLIEREIVARTSGFALIDADSVRQEPTIPDLDMPWEAHISDPEALCDVLDAIRDEGYQHIQIGVDNVTDDGLDDKAVGDLYFYCENESHGQDDEFRFADACEADSGERPVTSMFSADLLTDWSGPIDATDPEKVNIEVGTEFPVFFTLGGCEYGMDIKLLLAPRISSDEDGEQAYISETSWGVTYPDPQPQPELP